MLNRDQAWLELLNLWWTDRYAWQQEWYRRFPLENNQTTFPEDYTKEETG